MTALRTTTLLARLFLAAAAYASAAPGAADPVALADRFVHAQAEFDVETLRRVTADNYVEVSPVGDVDPRDKMLGFYGPENKIAGATAELTEPLLRTTGDNAIVIALVHFSFKDSGGVEHPSSLRATFVERKQDGEWKLVSTQFTPYRPSKPKAGQ